MSLPCALARESNLDAHWLVVYGALALVALIGAIRSWLRDPGPSRIAELRRLARDLGCSFDPIPVGAIGPPYMLFPCFRQGDSQVAAATIRGVWKAHDHPFPVTMGDFQYLIQRKNTEDTYTFSYLVIQLPFPEVPDLVLRKAGLLDRAAQAVGFERIAFESAEFNRRFVVRSANKKFAFDLISPAAMDFMLKGEGFSLDIRGGFCCLSGDPECWRPDGFRDRLQWLERFIKLWPAFLLDNLDHARE